MGAIPSKPTPEELEALVGRLDSSCRAAAEALLHADVLLLCTGAGFSADSGLAVYQDIAELSAYQKLGLHYHDICRPQWLRHDPELFYGFWGTCYNDYRDTEPHEGYRAVRQWRDDRFAAGSIVDEAVREAVRACEEDLKDSMISGAAGLEGGSSGSRGRPYPIEGHAGAFFVYTSNVDAHSFDYFEPWEVRECHGNTEVWQCGADTGPCCRDIWRAPLDFRFAVDKKTMRAPQCRERGSPAASPISSSPGAAEADAAHEEDDESLERARAGRVHKPFGIRTAPLSRLPAAADEEARMGFPAGANWPECPHCGARARPAILMFGDVSWVNDSAQEMRWWTWRNAVCTVARSARLCGRRLRVLVLEIGCGSNVPTVRHAAEGAAAQLAEDADVTVVRINPDYPLPDRLLSTSGHLRHLALPCRGLEALTHIQKHYESIHAADGKEQVFTRPVTRRMQAQALKRMGDSGEEGDLSDEPEPLRLNQPRGEIIRDASRSRSGSPCGPAGRAANGSRSHREGGALGAGLGEPAMRQLLPRRAKSRRMAAH